MEGPVHINIVLRGFYVMLCTRVSEKIGECAVSFADVVQRWSGDSGLQIDVVVRLSRPTHCGHYTRNHARRAVARRRQLTTCNLYCRL